MARQRASSSAALEPSVAQLYLPATQVPLEPAAVPLDALPPDEALGCDPPRPSLVADIRAVGVLQPVILVRRGEGYVVADGRSRVWAARKAGLATIPAVIAPEGHIAPSAVGAKANALRRDNPRTRLAFVEEATAAGLDDRDICRAGGFSPAELRAVRRLHGLIPALRNALDNGALGTATAREAAVLSVAEQETLAATVAAGQTVGLATVKAARQVDAATAAAALPAALFATPGAAPVPTTGVEAREDALAALPAASALPMAWRDGAAHLVGQAVALVPLDETAVHDGLTAVLALLKE